MTATWAFALKLQQDIARREGGKRGPCRCAPPTTVPASEGEQEPAAMLGAIGGREAERYGARPGNAVWLFECRRCGGAYAVEVGDDEDD